MRVRGEVGPRSRRAGGVGPDLRGVAFAEAPGVQPGEYAPEQRGGLGGLEEPGLHRDGEQSSGVGWSRGAEHDHLGKLRWEYAPACLAVTVRGPSRRGFLANHAHRFTTVTKDAVRAACERGELEQCARPPQRPPHFLFGRRDGRHLGTATTKAALVIF